MSDYLVIDSHGGPLHSFSDVDRSFAEKQAPTLARSNIAQALRVAGYLSLTAGGKMPSREAYTAYLVSKGYDVLDARWSMHVVEYALVHLPECEASVGDFYTLAFSLWVMDPKMKKDALYRNFAFWMMAHADQSPPDEKTFHILWKRTAKARKAFWSLSKQALS